MSSRREQILAAAAGLFARHGFHGVGIDEIGAAVGVSGPALYRHFRSKDAMLGEMLTSISDELLAGGLERRERTEDPAKLLGELVAFQVDFALDNPSLITVQERNLGNLTEPDRRRVRALQRRYVEVWVQAIRDTTPTFDEPAARAAAHAVFGLINSTPHSRYLGRDGMATMLRDMALGALGNVGPETASDHASPDT
ncbi:TetR/AcrR family transcriptional regulator [Actinophytocola oryzae]|uniref:TetR family transcriptional regulator n=1 Tax=Actinophytocola oryzae TaxID=502181 RepID=A0A4R7VSE8_9PSEU|nr:TetR/AcrR family transcriptional regulator [Actinophytocola oryzae]TDV52415.1 TetR family transcriptional regulator [Actinophytocola oryzae]